MRETVRGSQRVQQGCIVRVLALLLRGSTRAIFAILSRYADMLIRGVDIVALIQQTVGPSRGSDTCLDVVFLSLFDVSKSHMEQG